MISDKSLDSCTYVALVELVIITRRGRCQSDLGRGSHERETAFFIIRRLFCFGLLTDLCNATTALGGNPERDIMSFVKFIIVLLLLFRVLTYSSDSALRGKCS